MTKAMSAKVDVFEQWCLPASHPPYSLQSSRVQRRSEASHRLSTSVRDHLFQTTLLVWLYRAYVLAGNAAIKNPPRDWNRRRGRPAHTWTLTVEADLKSCNMGLHSAWHRTQDRNAWSRLVQTAIPQSGVRS